MIVEPRETTSGHAYDVVDGGRRFGALKNLRDAGQIDAGYPVDVVVIDRTASEAREISLAANVLRRDLHPVEEFEAFARLASDGMSVDKIAADFGRTTRFVRQRLALDRLSPTIRAAWRSGELPTEAAQAYTLAPDHAAQDHHFATSRDYQRLSNSIRAHFRSSEGTVRASDREALYVGLDAYQASGGTIDDNLFEDWSLCTDGPLLKRLARDKMMAEGAAILERTGFGTCLIESDVEQSWYWGRLPIRPTDDEKAALVAIDERDEATDYPDDDDEARALADGFQAEREAIEMRAILRGSTADERAQAAIFLSLSYEGVLGVEYGRTPPSGTTMDGAADAPTRSRTQTDNPTSEPVPTEKPPGKAVVEILDEARTAAFARLIADRPGLAILFCTAALRTAGNRSPLRIETWSRNGTIQDAPASNWTAALAELHGLPDRDHLFGAFASAVAQSVMLDSPRGFNHQSGRADHTDTTAMAEVLATYAGEAFAPALCAAFNYPAYFAAAPRAVAIAAIEEAGGDANAARKLKASEAATAAAELARDKAWLPKVLRPAPIATAKPSRVLDDPAPTLVDAMAEAIAADEAASPTEPVPPLDPLDLALSQFLDRHRARHADAKVKAGDFYQAFLASPFMVLPTKPTIRAVGEAVARAGIDSKRFTAGVHYVGFRLVDLPSQAAE